MYSRSFVDKNVDIKADNILIEIEDQGILEAFVDAEMTSPSPRQVVDGKPIYATRQFGLPKEYGHVVLGDFGSAVRGDKPQIHDAQPDVYRCPEVMLKLNGAIQLISGTSERWYLPSQARGEFRH